MATGNGYHITINIFAAFDIDTSENKSHAQPERSPWKNDCYFDWEREKTNDNNDDDEKNTNILKIMTDLRFDIAARIL